MRLGTNIRHLSGHYRKSVGQRLKVRSQQGQMLFSGRGISINLRSSVRCPSGGGITIDGVRSADFFLTGLILTTLFCSLCVHFLSIVVRLVVSASVTDCLERLVFEMTYDVSTEPFSAVHSIILRDAGTYPDLVKRAGSWDVPLRDSFSIFHQLGSVSLITALPTVSIHRRQMSQPYGS